LFAAAVDYAAEGKLWWAHIQYLADDKLEGRNVGTDGFRQAVEYVATRMERAGLKPAGTSGYLQPVKFETRLVVEDQSSLALVRDGNAEPLTLGMDATLSARADLAPSLEAPMVFVGYGMVIPEAKYDDLAGLDLHGKIAVYVNGPGPAEAPGPVKSHYSSGVERWNGLRKAGAVGIAMIANPRTPGGGNRGGTTGDTPAGGAGAATDGAGAEAGANGAAGGRAAGGRGGRGPAQPTVSLADPALQETVGQAIAIAINLRGAEKFFAGSGHSFEEIQRLARANEPLPKFPLTASLRAKTAMKLDSLESPNVIGRLPGADRKLKNEYVVLSAHLDHLGVGRPVNGDTIYNGAMDDASGIATILEVARILKASGARPKRSIVFLAVTAEEKGELGSRYFAAHPTVPAGQIVADINLDMFLPLYALKYIEVQGLGESTLGDTVRAAAKDLGVEVQADNEPEQNRFIRSDQYSFIRRGVPALAFKFGYAQGSPEEKIRKDWVRDRYHRPSDDLNQPVDTAAAAVFDRVILKLVERVADDPARPQWYHDSFFRRFAN
ncbi:MAG TPA: M20/M25/M40 family metallo-hydrolase, partial [Bryobacteraceae bacterium]|nr:M20/M25/M40 family metallo-hydrolase [Bryobacteraceae bacterium]